MLKRLLCAYIIHYMSLRADVRSKGFQKSLIFLNHGMPFRRNAVTSRSFFLRHLNSLVQAHRRLYRIALMVCFDGDMLHRPISHICSSSLLHISCTYPSRRPSYTASSFGLTIFRQVERGVATGDGAVFLHQNHKHEPVVISQSEGLEVRLP